MQAIYVAVYFSLGILFLILGILIILKGRTVENVFFASSGFMLTIFSFIMMLSYSDIYTDRINFELRIMASFLLVVSALGPLISAFLITHGRAILKNYFFWGMNVFYIFLQIILILFRVYSLSELLININTFSYYFSAALNNFFVIFPTGFTIYQFRLLGLTISDPSLKKKIDILNAGMACVFIGMLIYSILLIVDRNLITAGLIPIVFGMVIVNYAFITGSAKTSSKKIPQN